MLPAIECFTVKDGLKDGFHRLRGTRKREEEKKVFHAPRTPFTCFIEPAKHSCT